jgi:hypothetical protein
MWSMWCVLSASPIDHIVLIDHIRKLTTFISFFHHLHLLNQAGCAAEFVYDKKYITGIDHDIPANSGVVVQVAHGAFPYPVEIEPDEVAVCIQRGLPELPPVVWLVPIKATGKRPSAVAYWP